MPYEAESLLPTKITKDSRNAERIRIICKNKKEFNKIKEAAQKTVILSARIMRDQLYPIRINRVDHTAVLEQDGTVRTETCEVLGKKNKVNITKLV